MEKIFSTNRHERRRQQTRSKLIATAVKLMLEKGYDTVTIQEITETADLGRGTFYIHFKDKEDLVWSIVKEGMDAADQKAHLQVASGLPPKPEYYAYLNIFRHAEQNRDLYRLMLGSQGSAALTARVQTYLADDLEREMRSFNMYDETQIPFTIRAQIMVGAIIRLVIWWLETPNEYSATQIASILYQAIHHQAPPEGYLAS